ncbi:hypothetical protein AAFF_G00205120 [Aldrovandia affinis]|uniref:Uncharacterized protein n=1 Tax=Aldrovandia affinis TaxID=143900 RepID=A0AAD7R017_9TELE|nr:hypothetical protein AAFF_G00205120 [Aldrovandia affinis]
MERLLHGAAARMEFSCAAKFWCESRFFCSALDEDGRLRPAPARVAPRRPPPPPLPTLVVHGDSSSSVMMDGRWFTGLLRHEERACVGDAVVSTTPPG